jgi:hypothetical protein
LYRKVVVESDSSRKKIKKMPKSLYKVEPCPSDILPG